MARAGMHTGELVYDTSKRTPRAASASMWGVRTSGWPWQPRYLAECSSDMMTSRFCGAMFSAGIQPPGSQAEATVARACGTSGKAAPSPHSPHSQHKVVRFCRILGGKIRGGGLPMKPLFWLCYRRDMRLLGVVIIEAGELFEARMLAAIAGLDKLADFYQGYELSAQHRAMV